MRRIRSALVIVVVVAACGASPGAGVTTITPPEDPTSTDSSSPTTTTPSNVVSVGDLDIIVPPDENGHYPDDLMVSCGGAGVFPIGALEKIAPLEESDPGGVAVAIEEFLASGEGEYWPQEGWHILHATDAEVLLVAREGGLLFFMRVSNTGSGWTWSGASGGGDSCPVEFVVPEELNTVSWRLDPDHPEPTAESTDIAVILNERPCVDGREIGDRLLGPQVVMTGSQVFIAFAAERPSGDEFTCPGNPDTPHVVELPEALGDRELVEGLRVGINLDDYLD